MARNTQAARRYATALYDLFQSEGADKLTAIRKELETLSKTVETNPDLERFLSSPVLETSEKMEAIADLEKILPHTFRFICVLIEAARFDCLKDVVSHYVNLCEEATGELTVQVSTARQMPEKVLKRIQSLLEDRWERKIRIKFDIDPEVIGGFVAKAPGRLMDASVRAQMEHLQHVALN